MDLNKQTESRKAENIELLSLKVLRQTNFRLEFMFIVCYNFIGRLCLLTSQILEDVSCANSI